MASDRFFLSMVLRRLLMQAVGLSMVAAMSGCGGGGGGDGPNTSLSLSTRQVTVSATTDEVAPTASVVASLTNPPSGGVYVGYANTARAVSAVDFTDNGDTTATITLSFRAPAQLGVGVYTDTVTIYVCYDDRCARPVGNSPQTIAVEYRVTAGQNPLPGTPVVVSLSPPSVAAGSAAFTLTVTGTGFLPQSVLQWNGVARPTSYDSPTQITAQIGSNDIVNAGTVAVTVNNAAAGGGSSVAFDFTVLPPAALSLTRISPTGVEAGGPAFVLTAIGTGFTASSVVQWNGAARPTTFVSSTELTAQIGAADIAQVGSAELTVFTPGGLGKVSSAQALTVIAHSIDATAFQIDPNHSGTVRFNNVSLPATSRWTVDLGGAPSYALIASGRVYVTVNLSGGSSQLVALDQATGATLWGPIVLSGQANAAYDAGAVFVLSSTIGSAALIQAYDAATGQLKWSTVLAGQYSFSSPPTAAHGYVYTGGAGSGGTLYAVDQSNGVIAWTRSVANGDSSAPAVSSDGVFVTYPCTTYAFRPATGEQTWSNNTGCSGGGGATPVVANGVLYAPNGFGSYNGSTFNAATGSLLGAYVADNPPAIDAQSGYFLQSGTLRGVTLANNTVQWSFAGDGALVSSPIVVNQYVFVGASSGRLYAVDASSGQQLWMKDLGAAIPAGSGWGARMPISGLSAGDGLLVVPAGNTLTAFTLSTAP
jgi:outer membrane protein assembly factor BamB